MAVLLSAQQAEPIIKDIKYVNYKLWSQNQFKYSKARVFKGNI